MEKRHTMQDILNLSFVKPGSRVKIALKKYMGTYLAKCIGFDVKQKPILRIYFGGPWSNLEPFEWRDRDQHFEDYRIIALIGD